MLRGMAEQSGQSTRHNAAALTNCENEGAVRKVNQRQMQQISTHTLRVIMVSEKFTRAVRMEQHSQTAGIRKVNQGRRNEAALTRCGESW